MLSALKAEPAKNSSREPHPVRTYCSLGQALKVFSAVRMADSRDLRYKKITFVDVLWKMQKPQEYGVSATVLLSRYAALVRSTLAKYVH
jgi:hypothetical protein